MENIAIHQSQTSQTVVKFVDLKKFTPEFQDQYNNNKINGVYLNEAGAVVAEDIWQTNVIA